MKSDVINVSSKADQIEKVLSQAERVAVYQQLSPKAALRLRLLAEETESEHGHQHHDPRRLVYSHRFPGG